MGLREGLAAYVCSSELYLDVMFAISSHVAPSFIHKLPNFNDFNPSEPSISLEMVVKNEDFIILILTSLSTLFSWLRGPQKRSLRTLLATFCTLLGLLGNVSRSSWELPKEFLEPSWAAKRPRCPPEPPKPPQDLPKTSPRTLQEGPRDPQEASKLLSHKLQRVPEKLSKGPRRKREDNVN